MDTSFQAPWCASAIDLPRVGHGIGSARPNLTFLDVETVAAVRNGVRLRGEAPGAARDGLVPM